MILNTRERDVFWGYMKVNRMNLETNRIGYWQLVWNNANYRKLWFADLISNGGDWFNFDWDKDEHCNPWIRSFVPVWRCLGANDVHLAGSGYPCGSHHRESA